MGQLSVVGFGAGPGGGPYSGDRCERTAEVSDSVFADCAGAGYEKVADAYQDGRTTR